MAIHRFVWTTHALKRLPERGLTRETVESMIRQRHPLRKSNEGKAEWRLDAGRFVVLYDHPHNGDMDAVHIVTIWRKRRRPRRHLRVIDETGERYR